MKTGRGHRAAKRLGGGRSLTFEKKKQPVQRKTAASLCARRSLPVKQFTIKVKKAETDGSFKVNKPF